MTSVEPAGGAPIRVEPVAGGRDRGGRLRLAAPFVALALIVGAAWAGSARPPGVAIVDAAAQPTGAPGAPAGSAGSSSATRTVTLPATALGLPVRDATELAAARAAGRLGGEAVAVAGVMRSDPLPLYCGAIRQTLSRDFCLRMIALFPFDAPAPGASPAPGGSAAPEHGAVDTIVPPGVALPPIVVQVSDLAPWLTGRVPVVFVGHFEDERAPACPGGRGWCRGDLVLERLAWLAGREVAAGIAVDPALEAASIDPDGPAGSALRTWIAGRRAELLSTSVIGATGLKGVVDQPLRDSGRLAPDATWWYARVLVPATLGAPASVAWLVLDPRTGAVLATGA